MALAYAWGLILSIYLMGHGLVALPRRLIYNANTSARLRHLQVRAPKMHEKLTEAMDELDDLESQVMQLRQKRTAISRDFQDWIEDLVETSALPESRMSGAANAARSNVPSVVTERYLADLTRKLKRARHKKARFEREWAYLVQDAANAQAILDSAASKRLVFDRLSGSSSSSRNCTLLTPYTRYVLHAHIVPFSRLLLGGFLALASMILVWSEVATPIWHPLSLVSLTVSPHSSINFGGQILGAAWLCYMILTALYTVSTAKVWGNRALVPRSTYPESACWYSYQVAKLTVPLSYNFITLLPQDVYKSTVFYKFLGKLINLTPLGANFSRFFPVFILLPVLAAAFNLYGRIPAFLGWSSLEEDDDDNETSNPSGFGTGGWREGRALIEREIQANSQSSNSLGLRSRDESPASITAGRSASGLASTRAQENYRDRQPLVAALPEDTVDRAAPRAAERGGARAEEAEGGGTEDEEGFFADFAHRVRNTFETTDRPAWMQDLSFKKPKWMSGGDEGSGEGSGNSGGLNRWFGGGNGRGTGRLRL
ncbi:MAG: hypothetical protein M1820_010925 [Bogoriella megaspora]|nr:MAG: hypothetical protein M1820_010925 [Bogoriella megaspora]